jgi:hypothetical protein
MDESYKEKDEFLTHSDWVDSVHVLNAVNLSGVVHSFSKVMSKISNESSKKGRGTDWKNHHPIARMYAEKISELSGAGYPENGPVSFYDAYEICKEKIGYDITS